MMDLRQCAERVAYVDVTERVEAIERALREAQGEQRQADVTKLKEAAKNQGGAFQCCALALLNMAEAIEAGGHK